MGLTAKGYLGTALLGAGATSPSMESDGATPLCPTQMYVDIVLYLHTCLRKDAQDLGNWLPPKREADNQEKRAGGRNTPRLSTYMCLCTF